ncbi:hypothetical protein [Catellatospora tritici]|uniref:hypothetical protein n=1 Tax=Catellatospora tritici TaxID=2851566 RepID=UPI001C2CFCC5|nr:hypothetical protein [Catellatospora tritici]MBV1852750.1 hypothetical protein [Catellatospora tritici]
MSVGDILVWTVAVVLLAAVAFFVKAVFFDKRPQKFAFALSILSIPLYLIYFADRWPWGDLPMRKAVQWLDNFDGADPGFDSSVAPAFIIGAVLLTHLVVLQRVAAGRRLERLQDPIATFFSSTVLAALVGGVLVSTFHWGWTGSVIVAVVYTLVYLGVLALLAAVIEILVELAKLLGVWLKRRAFLIATGITRGSSFVSSLAGRLGLTDMAEKIRAKRDGQEAIFVDEQDAQDKELYAAFLRDRAAQRRMAGRSEEEIAAEIQELTAPEGLVLPDAPVEEPTKKPSRSRRGAVNPAPAQAEAPAVETVPAEPAAASADA